MTDPNADEATSMRYPFAAPSAPYLPVRLAAGIEWVRMPVPGPLNHVNLWLLRGEAGNTAVDCGQFDAPTRASWVSLLETRLPIDTILLTHAHADHAGCLGMLVERTGASSMMSAVEADVLAERLGMTDEETTRRMLDWLTLCGCPAERHADMVDARLGTRRYYAPPPSVHQLVADGDILKLSDRTWHVRLFGGHSPGMVTLFEPKERLLIVGDQVLPMISPLIGNYPLEKAEDPLGTYLRSLDTLACLPEETLVLPSHGKPFHGLHRRLHQLRSHHAERLTVIADAARGGATIHDVAAAVFPHALRGKAARQALCETHAHLVHLQREGRLAGTPDADGVLRYSVA